MKKINKFKNHFHVIQTLIDYHFSTVFRLMIAENNRRNFEAQLNSMGITQNLHTKHTIIIVLGCILHTDSWLVSLSTGWCFAWFQWNRFDLVVKELWTWKFWTVWTKNGENPAYMKPMIECYVSLKTFLLQLTSIIIRSKGCNSKTSKRILKEFFSQNSFLLKKKTCVFQ